MLVSIIYNVNMSRYCIINENHVALVELLTITDKLFLIIYLYIIFKVRTLIFFFNE